MSDHTETDKPNEFGFAGEGTAPQPEPTTESDDEAQGESIAVPAGDLTGAITSAMDEVTEKREEETESGAS